MRIDAETSLFDIIDLMRRPQGASVQEICTTLGCQRTTFYRYQDKLNAFGIPYYNKDDLDGNTSSKRWYIDEEDYRRTIPVKLDHVERMMLRTILGRARVFDGTRLKPRMDGLRAKLNSTLLHDRTKRIATTVYSFKGSVSYEGKEEIIDTLCGCIESRTRATVTYQSAKSKEPKQYDIDPYTLVDHGNALYVIVAVPKHEGDIRILAVDRIRKLDKTGIPFSIPDSFDPEQYLNPSFGIFIEELMRVRVRFRSDTAVYARERTWGQDQSVVDLEDGAIELAFTAAGFEEIVRWALSFGKGARVLEPERLVERVKEELEQAAAGY
jgi:predicted DNA-binding transcriptional regulator YafY